MKIMASSPITSWQIGGEKPETVRDFIFLGSKITVDGDCSHEIKRRLLHGRKAMTNLNIKSRDITLPTKVHMVKAIIFSVVTYGCAFWTIKKAKHWKMDSFELWCWRSLLRVPWMAEIQTSQSHRKSTLNILGWTDAEAPMLWPTDVKSRFIGKEPDAGKDWRQEEKGTTEDEMAGWMVSPTQWTWVWTNSRGQWRTEKPGMLQSTGSQRVVTQRLNNNHPFYFRLLPLATTSVFSASVRVFVFDFT